MISKALFTSISCHWKTPAGVYRMLDSEFDFDFDPCPFQTTVIAEGDLFIKKPKAKHAVDGLTTEWGRSTFCNPPYSNVSAWIRKGYAESRKGKTVVFLVAARTDTRWFHNYCTKGEVRFIKGRLRFGNAKYVAPFPSMIVIFKGKP